MKRILKRTLAVLMTVVMLIGVAPLNGFVGLELPDWLNFCTKASALASSGTCGDNVSWSYNSFTGTLNISGTGKMKDYDGNSPFKGSNGIKKVIIENGVTSVGGYAFYCCYSLTSVIFPDSISNIGNDAFCGCDNLVNVTISTNVTSLNIGRFAFDGCKKLNKITLPDGVEKIGSYAFRGCTELSSLTIPDSVSTIGWGAFESCINLNSVTLPDTDLNIENCVFDKTALFNNSNNWENDVLYIGHHLIKAKSDISGEYVIKSGTIVIADSAFLSCKNLTNIEMPESLINIGKAAFSGTGLINVTMPNSVSSIRESAFGHCANLSEIVLPNSLINIGEYAFEYCTKLQSISIPNCITHIGEGVFYNCTSLSSVTIPKSVTSIKRSAFQDCKSLKKIYISSIETWCNITFNNGPFENYNLFLNGELITDLTIPDGVTSIGNHSFSGCISLTNVKLPIGIKNIGYKAFYNCTSLTSATIPNSVLNIGEYAFWYCNKLKSLEIPNSVRKIESGSFGYCYGLTNVIIPDSVLSIGDYAFYTCYSLKDVYYAGTEEQWDNISFGQYNEDLLNATIHFNSGSEPFDPDENLYHLYAFSNEPNLMMSDKGSMRLTFQTDCYDYEHDAYLLSGVEYTVTSSDNHVASIKSINAQDDKTTVLLYGENPGTAMLTVTANYDGHAVAGGQFPITVKGEGVYHADNIPKFNDYNIICNGILIDNYKYTKTDGETCEISFDAYNTHNCFGAVEVHDKNGELLYSQSLANCPTGIPSSLWDTVAELFNVTDYNNRSYKDEDCSKKTSVDISGIPRDGYITISNDVMSSQVCAIYNLAYLTAEVSFKCLKLVTSSDTEDDAKAEIAENLGKEIIELILDSPKDTADKTFKSVVKKFISAANLGSKSGMNEAVKSFALIIKDLDIDLTGIVWDALKASAISVAKGTVEKALYTALGIPGTLMEASYDLIGIGETASIIQSVSDNVNSGKTSIYCSNSASEVKYSNGYLVRSQELFDMNNVTFHQYKIVNGKSYDDAAAAFKDEKIVNVISMALYQNGVEVQPKGSVEVAIPVPKGMNALHAKIFRQESDGSYTQLKYRLDDGYMYITTEHFSVYCIVGDYDYGDYLEFEDAEITLKPEDVFCQYPLTHSGNDAEYADYVWTSSNTNVVQVDDSGIIAAIGDGAATITVTERNRNLTASYKVNVKSDKILKLNLDKEETINYKKSFNIKDKYSVECSENYTVKYESSNPKVATVDQNGNVYGAKKGSADIKVTVTDSAGNTVTDTCNVKVKYSFGQWLIVILLFGWIWY